MQIAAENKKAGDAERKFQFFNKSFRIKNAGFFLGCNCKEPMLVYFITTTGSSVFFIIIFASL